MAHNMAGDVMGPVDGIPPRRLDAPVDDGNDGTLRVIFAENPIILEEHWKDRDRHPYIVVLPRVSKKPAIDIYACSIMTSVCSRRGFAG